MKKSLKLIMLCLTAIIAALNSPMKEVRAAEEAVIVYAQVPEDWKEPCLWAWSADGKNAFEAWPGNKMAEDEENSGWYYAYVPNWVSAVIVNANEGTVQTEELLNNSKNSWIQVVSAEEVSLSNEQATNGELPEYVEVMSSEETTKPEVSAEEMITVYAKVPSEWLLPCLWAWSAPDGTNAFANWPGEEMAEGEDGWYSYDIPNWVNSVIVNGNLGEVQTTDISIEPKDVWLVVNDAETTEVFYEKPADMDNQQAEVTVEPSQETVVPEKTDSGNTALIIVVILVIAVLAGGIVVFTQKKKK